ncbi:zinc metalloproteinase nas-15-like [Bradysia coprophila]|uniref:zinc metalloproteinase nas-15-like n=1 Tax=Bradysia coprophila TaxID=38358 RepID=UPI00187D8C16|nr:zinc metalloproteinase nas-15-like [Bradysia coprophila]
MSFHLDFHKVFLLSVCFIATEHFAAIVVPKISSIQHPPVPNNFFLHEPSMLSDDPELAPGLYQGDIAIDNIMHDFWKVGLLWTVFPERLWPNNTVPYYISPLYDPADHMIILKALRTIKFMTCIRFIPWNGVSKDFLLIWPMKYPKGCWSYVGRIGGPQIVSLQPPSGGRPNCLGTEARPIHELLHALGIFHEQSRADRDDYVTVHWENIREGYENNFEKQSLSNTSFAFEYDYDSVMHYGRNYFSKQKGKPTLTSKMPGMELGQRRGMSVTDCLKVNDLYRCLDNPRSSRKYYSLCKLMGIGNET